MKKITLAALLFAVSVQAAVCAGYDALNIGIQYANDGAWDNAIQWLGKAIDTGDLLPDQIRAAHYNRARAYDASGKPSEAIAEYSTALTLTPDDIRILSDRAFAYVTTGQGEKAIADFQIAHQKRPKSAKIDFDMGLVYWTQDRPRDASIAFADALKESKSPYAWLWVKLSDSKQKKETSPYPYNPATYDSGAWPHALMSLYIGDNEEAAVFDNVKNYGEKENCEASFYVAEWRLVHADTPGAKSMFQKSAGDCSIGDMELMMANLELAKLP